MGVLQEVLDLCGHHTKINVCVIDGWIVAHEVNIRKHSCKLKIGECEGRIEQTEETDGEKRN